MPSVRKTNCTVYTPDNLKGDAVVFILYPGIPVTCSAGNKLDLPVQKNIGEVYMPPSVRKGVPDWFNKYVLVFPHTHTAQFNSVKSELDGVLSEKSLTLKSLNVGVFSGSGNISIPNTVKLTTYLVMDTTVGGNTSAITTRVLKDGGKVFCMFGPSNWGGASKGYGTNYWKPVFSQLQTSDWGEIKSSTYASFGFPPDDSTGCEQRLWHMVMPQYFLAYFKSKIEEVQPKTTPPTGPSQSNATTTQPPVATTQNTEPVADKKPNLTGRIVIKKKSGPGEITGITELELSNVESSVPYVEFKELQFTEGGDYVITLTPTSPDLIPLDISIKVLPEPEVIAQDPKTEENPRPAKGNRPIIAQIDAPTIKLDKITMPTDPISKGSDQKDGLGVLPTISYNGNFIKLEDIKFLRIYHDGIIPKMDITFKDTLNLLKDTGTPEDQTTIDVFINATSPNIKSIHLSFKIDNYDKEEKALDHSMSGTLNVPDLYVQNNNAYSGTSFEVLRKICSELGIGFNSNIENTEDKMKWRNTNKRPFEFMEEIIKHSYISDESYMKGYIDYYYCFNYVDINKEMKRDNVKDAVIDTVPHSRGIGDEEKIVELTLSTDKSLSSSSLFIDKFNFSNNSTEVSLQEGYKTKTTFYDRVKKAFMVFKVDSQSSDGKESLILKSTQGDSNFYDKNIVTRFLGKLDSDNTHINHNYAVVQNQINIRNMQKIQMDISLPSPNYCIYKLMKININVTNESTTPTQENLINYRYSGNYILDDISFTMENKKIRQELKLYRSELGKTPDEIKNQTPTKKPTEAKENNPNPDVPGASPSVPQENRPNAIYAPGEVYFVKDANGKKYKIKVKEILSNGTEVIGTLEEIS